MGGGYEPTALFSPKDGVGGGDRISYMLYILDIMYYIYYIYYGSNFKLNVSSYVRSKNKNAKICFKIEAV